MGNWVIIQVEARNLVHDINYLAGDRNSIELLFRLRQTLVLSVILCSKFSPQETPVYRKHFRLFQETPYGVS